MSSVHRLFVGTLLLCIVLLLSPACDAATSVQNLVPSSEGAYRATYAGNTFGTFAAASPALTVTSGNVQHQQQSQYQQQHQQQNQQQHQQQHQQQNQQQLQQQSQYQQQHQQQQQQQQHQQQHQQQQQHQLQQQSQQQRPQPQYTQQQPLQSSRPSTVSGDKDYKYSSSSPASTEERVLDRYDNRYPDGSYEFRYELTDGTARYERGYFVLFDQIKSLVVVGYYSYRMPDGRFITVFYNADRNGYRQNQSITPQVYPNLPRRIEVPAAEQDLKLQPQQDTAQTPATLYTTKAPFRTPTTTTRRGRF